MPRDLSSYGQRYTLCQALASRQNIGVRLNLACRLRLRYCPAECLGFSVWPAYFSLRLHAIRHDYLTVFFFGCCSLFFFFRFVRWLACTPVVAWPFRYFCVARVFNSNLNTIMLCCYQLFCNCLLRYLVFSAGAVQPELFGHFVMKPMRSR